MLWADGEQQTLEFIASQRCDGVVAASSPLSPNPAQLIAELQRIGGDLTPPVIVYGARRMDAATLAAIGRLARNSVIRYAPTTESLLDESVVLFHRREDLLSPVQQSNLAALRENDPLLVNKRVLVVDDDLRNIFALTSVLEHHNIQVFHAENGRAGIELLKETPGIDCVLMDIMMPEMDGYQSAQKILEYDKSTLIVAFTADNMPESKRKAEMAGIRDFISKPVRIEELKKLFARHFKN
jgi:CheY-like chemotaxis protein